MGISFPDQSYEGVYLGEFCTAQVPVTPSIHFTSSFYGSTPPHERLFGVCRADPADISLCTTLPSEGFNDLDRSELTLFGTVQLDETDLGLDENPLLDHNYTTITNQTESYIMRESLESILSLTPAATPEPVKIVYPQPVPQLSQCSQHVYKPSPSVCNNKIRRKYTRKATAGKLDRKVQQKATQSNSEPVNREQKVSKNKQEKVRRSNLRMAFDRLKKLVYLPRDGRPSNLAVLNQSVEAIELLEKNKRLKKRLQELESEHSQESEEILQVD